MIELKSSVQIDEIRRASIILKDTLNILKKMVSPGISTDALDNAAREKILSSDAKCAFLGYKGYPKSICVSINEEIVHGIPGARILKEGDIVSIDVGVEYNGFFSDAAVTVPVGSISVVAKKLIDTTRQALYKAIDKAVPGNRISDISCAVEETAVKNGFNVVREFVGHGVGIQLHEDPQIPNFGQPGMGIKLKEGMVLAIEPMVTAGRHGIEILSDGWTAVTKDKSLSAHFEHTIAISQNGTEILTEGI
jgi:methionyl aminopeptidase